MNIRCWLGLHRWDAWERALPGAKAPALFVDVLERLASGVRAGTASVERVEVERECDRIEQNGGPTVQVFNHFEVRIFLHTQYTPLDEATLRELPTPVVVEVVP